MHILRLAGVIALLSAFQAEAGPWPRGEGTVFLSFGFEQKIDLERLPLVVTSSGITLYAEYGASPRTTVGLDYFGDLEAGYTAIAFVRRTLTAPEQRNQFALTLGLGQRSDGITKEMLAMAGASWGRGIETRWGDGWMTLDAAVRKWASGGTVFKLDGTMGIRPSNELAMIGQVLMSDYPNSPTETRLAASVLYRFSERFSLETGAFYTLSGAETAGVTIKLWTEF